MCHKDLVHEKSRNQQMTQVRVLYPMSFKETRNGQFCLFNSLTLFLPFWWVCWGWLTSHWCRSWLSAAAPPCDGLQSGSLMHWKRTQNGVHLTEYLKRGKKFKPRKIEKFSLVCSKSNRVFRPESHSVTSANIVDIYWIKLNKSCIELEELISKYCYYCFDACFCKCGIVYF